MPIPPMIKKRDGSLVPFDAMRIQRAIEKAFESNDESCASMDALMRDILAAIEAKQADLWSANPIGVEAIQDIVEDTLIDHKYHHVSKAYILYRNKRAEMRKPDIFKKRTNLKPYEYPELREYVDAIRHSYWVHTEFNFTSDVQDFKVNINEAEKHAIKHTMLAIAQIEVAVKSFWGDIYKKFPKPEIAAVGFTFAESEVRHADAYSHLLEILGLNEEFAKINEMPVLMHRVKYLEGVIQTSKTDSNVDYTLAILLFSLFIEHVSLFSQFLIMMSFNKYKNLFKWISNAVEATSKEEQIHWLFGIEVINVIKSEHPEWFDEDFEHKVLSACQDSLDSEIKVVDWICEKWELDFLPKAWIIEFIKHRLNNSLVSIGVRKLFEVDMELVKKTQWFDDEIIATKHGDFFDKRSINYNKRSKSISADDLF